MSRVLRDRLVAGVSSDELQRQLLNTKALIFDIAVEMCLNFELTASEVREMRCSSSVINAIDYNKKKKGKSNQTQKKNAVANPKVVCYCCGRNHLKRDCYYKNNKCYRCEERGHMANMCSKRNTKGHSANPNSNAIDEVNEIQDEIESGNFTIGNLNQVSEKKNEALLTEVMVSGVRMNMEVDTGACRSIISYVDFQKHFCHFELINFSCSLQD